MKIYTGRGDFGNTNLIGGRTVKKTDLRVHAYGDLDELNSHVGMLESLLEESDVFHISHTLSDAFAFIQTHLFDIGTDLADKEKKLGISVSELDIKWLEKAIDTLNESLPELTHFILPGGFSGASQAHICRTVTRRVERSILALKETEADAVDANITTYINRLSDFFFVLARYLNWETETEENTYTKTGEVFHND